MGALVDSYDPRKCPSRSKSSEFFLRPEDEKASSNSRKLLLRIVGSFDWGFLIKMLIQENTRKANFPKGF